MLVPKISPATGIDEVNKIQIVLSEGPHRRNCSLNSPELLVVANLHDIKDFIGKANA
jgi:hypothetical protein